MNTFKKKVIVTGGCGFIGSHLTDLLLKTGYCVTVIDNFSTGRLLNLGHHADSADLNIIQADINDYEKLESHFKDAEFVFHLAALADIVPSIEDPLAYHKANVDGTVSVLMAARKHNVKKFVYAASSSCYGIPNRYPTEETDEIRPQYPYALTKNVGEQYVMHWGKIYDLPVVALRLFNVYGTRSRTSGTYGAVFGVFLKQKLSGKPYTVVGNGEQTRDFTYVTDVASAFYEAAVSDVKGEIMNVGSGNTYSINTLTGLLGGDKVYIPKRPGEPDCTFANIKKITRLLNWRPRVAFEQGVKNVLDNIDYWKDAPLWDSLTIEKATASWFKYLSK